ncbi:MAG: hypothetical protein Q8J64_07065 [Thermodesulfovibrionales bacterium]|nr:hypothetical protein [Thermodesulfovibrionales bacterium]
MQMHLLKFFYALSAGALSIFAGEPLMPSPPAGPVDASGGLSALLWGVIAIVGAPVAFFVIRKTLRAVAESRQKGLIEEMKSEAKQYEAAGEFVSAGLLYEKLKNLEQAAVLYEKGRDFMRAAALYKAIERPAMAMEMYEKAGDLGNAAETAVMVGDYAAAARFYKRLGNGMKAAEALEDSGNRLAAVGEYREAGNYARAAYLLKEEGMPKEAAEMYRLSLAGEKKVDVSNADKYYAYALLLEAAGKTEEAAKALKGIIAVAPDYRDAGARLEAISPPGAQAEAGEVQVEKATARTPEVPLEEPCKRETSLRGIIQQGRLEPRHAMRLWVQALKSLALSHKNGIFMGRIEPDAVFIDANNNVRLGRAELIDFAYSAPETVSGKSPDAGADIYSMGVILFEMLTGSLDNAGVKKPSETGVDVPAWLDGIVLKCMEKDRGRRYQNLDEIFAAIKEVKGKA